MPNDTPEPGEIPWPFGQNQSNDDTAPDSLRDADNAPIVTQSPLEPPPLPPQAKFHPLDPSDLSERELRDFNMELALHKAKGEIDLELHKAKRKIDLEYHKELLALKKATVPAPPNEYNERFSIWLLYLKLLPSVLVLGIILWIMWGMATTSLFENWGADTKLPWWGLTSAFLVICIWFIRRTFVVWNTTMVVCNMIDTGVMRPPNTWLFIGNYSRMMKTSAIQGKDKRHPWLLRTLHMNSWWVNFSTPSDDENKIDVLEDKHFIKDGDRLANTINEMQKHQLALAS